MSVNSTSYQFSAAYGTTMTWKHEAPSALPVTQEDIENSKPTQMQLSKTLYTDSWQSLWRVQETETVNDDGTVTKTVSGGVNFHIANKNRGCTASGSTDFQVSVTFNPDTYEAGQLTSTVDIMAAAFAVSKAALKESFSCQWAENYQDLKDEVAKSFADMAGAPLEEQGRAGEKEKIYQSVHAVFASFEAKYEAVTASVDKAHWMDADLWTAAAKLQKIGMSFQMDSGRVKGLYSLRELEYTAIGLRAGMNLKA